MESRSVLLRSYTSSRLTCSMLVYTWVRDTSYMLRKFGVWTDDGTGRRRWALGTQQGRNLEIVAHRRADAALLLSVDQVGSQSQLRLGLPLAGRPRAVCCVFTPWSKQRTRVVILNYWWTESESMIRTKISYIHNVALCVACGRSAWQPCAACSHPLTYIATPLRFCAVFRACLGTHGYIHTSLIKLVRIG
jgi:hypothetical protein